MTESPVPPWLLAILCFGLIVLVVAIIAGYAYYRQAKQCEINPSPYCWTDWTCSDGSQPRVTGFNTTGAGTPCDPVVAAANGSNCNGTPSQTNTSDLLSPFGKCLTGSPCCPSNDPTQCKTFS